MHEVVYYVAMSIDGRIAGDDHDLTFLETLGGNAGDFGYGEFIATIDSLVMGAETWRFIVRHGSWAYVGKPAWIVTHAPTLEPLEGADVRPWAGDDVGALVREIADAGQERTWLVGGGSLAGQFVERDVLDEIHLAIAPAIVGTGPVLVDGSRLVRRFALESLDRIGDGVVARYRRRPDD